MKTIKLLLILGAILLPEMASAAATFTQQHWRWRNDDGNEATATWKAAQNGAISGVSRGTNIRGRFAVANTSTSQPGSLVPKLEYATSTSGPWTAVSTASDGSAPFEMTTTSGYADGESTTAQLPGTGSFAAGKAVEWPNNTSASVSYGVSQNSNFEYCFRATAKATGGTTYFFRVSNNGVPIDAYSTYATLTMQGGGRMKLLSSAAGWRPMPLWRRCSAIRF